MKLDLDPAELDLVMAQVVLGPWSKVNNVIQKIMKQLNDKNFQGEALPQAPEELPLTPVSPGGESGPH